MKAPQVLDAYGRPIRVAKLPERLAEPGLTGVRQIWAGSVAGGLTPVRMAAILRNCDQGQLDDFLVLAEEMEERDPHYLSVLGTRKRIISAVKPKVIATGESAQEKLIAKAVEDRIANHDGFPKMVEDLLDALGKSFAVIHIGWEKDATAWWPASFDRRDPRFFVFDRETGDELRLKSETDPLDGEALEPGHFMVHRAALKSGLTYRGGLARMVAFGWMCKQYTVKDWMAFIETYGLPIRLGRYGKEATPEDVQVLFSAVANIGTDAAAVLPREMDIEFTSPGNVRGDVLFENLARYIDEQTSKVVLGQTMTADSGSSQAQATVHDGVRHDIAAADARSISGTINRDLVRVFVDVNFGTQKVYPKILIEVPEPEDTKLLIEGAVALAGIGVRFKASELRGKLGLSDPADGDEIVGGLPPAAAPVAPPATRTALNRAQAPDPVDEIVDEMLEDWEAVMGDLVAPVQALLDECDDYDTFMARLPDVIKGQSTARVIDALVKGTFKARALGDQTDG
jgi:phage gp29-like protein